VFCGTPSLAFTYGLGGLLLFPFRARACVALQERSDDILRTAETSGATILFTSPAMYRVLADLVPRYRLSALRRCISAGETLPPFVYQLWLEKTGLQIMDGIGSTEMLHIFISCADGNIQPGSTGVVVPGYEAQVIDDHGQPVPPGTIGRLAVRGPTGCRYLNNPDSQSRYVQRGWNVTGDAYVLDQQGHFHYYARLDDMIITEGHNVSPIEVEGALLRHPAVKECAVVGLPDVRRGTSFVKAFIVPKDGSLPGDELPGQLRAHLKAELAPFKCPREIEVIAALPRTSTGKVQRFQLRVTEEQRV
jgi:2-aminobenzoate-CoA ligase